MTTFNIVDVMDEVFASKFNNVHTAIPGEIISFEGYVTMLATVRPLIKKITVADESIDMPEIFRVPVSMPRSKAGSLLIPLVAGDTGYINFSETAITNFIDAGVEGDRVVTVEPEDNSRFSYSEAWFTPGIAALSKMPPTGGVADTDTALIAGENLIVLNDAGIKLEREDMTVQITNDGKISINGVSEELIAILSEFINLMTAATTVTSIGPQPFTPDFIAQINAIKTRFDTLKV